MPRTKPVFISHAHADKPVVDALVDLLEGGIGIPANDVFCTALEGLGIPAGADFVAFIKDQIRTPRITLLAITRRYLRSDFCLAELGASWAVSQKVIPLLLEPMKPTDFNGILRGMHIVRADEPDGLNQLCQELVAHLKDVKLNLQRWDVKKMAFLESLAQLAALASGDGSPVEDSARARHYLEGVWNAAFYYDDNREYKETIKIKQINEEEFAGTIVPSLSNYADTAKVEHRYPLRLRGRLYQGDVLTGVWFQPVRPTTHGAFQLKIAQSEEALSGGWLMYSDSRGEPVSNRWVFERMSDAAGPRIGIYGITGVGKTTLCQMLEERVRNCRYFSESAIIDDFMKRIHGNSLEEFKLLSEVKRMEGRQKAFLFHAERLRYTEGTVLGDAHFSFPLERLGSHDSPHPERRNGIQPVMPDAAWNIYQAVIYIETSPSIVNQRLKKQSGESGRNRWAALLTDKRLQDWISYEKTELERMCLEKGKQFILLSGDGSPEEMALRAKEVIEAFRPSAY